MPWESFFHKSLYISIFVMVYNDYFPRRGFIGEKNVQYFYTYLKDADP
jgi:hypothetical protein